MEKVYELYTKVYGDIPEKTKDYIEKNMKTDRVEVICLYTLYRSPFNFITNNLLRSSRNPSEIFYCQPYFYDLFKVIKDIHTVR